MNKNQQLKKQWDEIFKFRKEQKYAHAIFYLRKLIQKYPEERPVGNKMLGIVFWEASDNRRAALYFKKALTFFPKSDIISISLTHALWDIGRKRDALSEIDRFLEIKPKSKDHLDFLKAVTIESGDGKHFDVVLEIKKLVDKYKPFKSQKKEIQGI